MYKVEREAAIKKARTKICYETAKNNGVHFILQGVDSTLFHHVILLAHRVERNQEHQRQRLSPINRRKDNTMTKNANYNIDFFTSTIIITKKFYKAASVLNSPEYKELMQARRDNPDFTIVLREIKKKEGKKSYRNLNYANMRTFIENYETDDGVRADRIKEFEKVMELSKVQSGPYAYVKTWFLKMYGEAYNPEEKADGNSEEDAAA